jgi:riboflavin kinase / FMN adenylyltransferase
VRFRRFLRPEARFESLDALRTQMLRDRDAALAFFAAETA